MSAEVQGVRDIDPGQAMTRFARGWHCLGLAEDFRDGSPHGIDAFGTRLVVFADSAGKLNVLDGYCRHMGGDLSGHRQRRRRRLSVPRLALGRQRSMLTGALRQTHTAAGPYPGLVDHRGERPVAGVARPRGQQSVG